MRPRYELMDNSLTMIFWQSLDESKAQPLFDNETDGWLDLDKTAAGIKEVYQYAKQSLDTVPKGAKASIRKLITFFLHCRQNASVLDIQMHNLFAFIEAIDGSKTLSGNELAGLLNVSNDMAKELVCVRNAFSHGTHTLTEAIDEHVNMTREEFQIVAVQNGTKKEATFMNFLHSRCNRVFLNMIGSTLQEAQPYPSQ